MRLGTFVRLSGKTRSKEVRVANHHCVVLFCVTSSTVLDENVRVFILINFKLMNMTELATSSVLKCAT